MMKHYPIPKALGLHSLSASNNTISNEFSIITSTSKANYNLPEQCTKFQTYNAPISPFYASWHKRIKRSEDATCFYLIESVKRDAQADFKRDGVSDIYNMVMGVRSDILAGYTHLNYVIERVAKSGSTMLRSPLKHL